jgi:hypothetical protein
MRVRFLVMFYGSYGMFALLLGFVAIGPVQILSI